MGFIKLSPRDPSEQSALLPEVQGDGAIDWRTKGATLDGIYDVYTSIDGLYKQCI